MSSSHDISLFGRTVNVAVYDPNTLAAKGFAETASDEADRAEAAADGLSDLQAATAGMVTPTEGDPVGVFPLANTSDEWGRNTMAYVGTAAVDSVLSEFAVDIRFVGDGTHKLAVASGDISGQPSTADFAIVSLHDLPEVESIGEPVYDEADFGEVPIPAGHHLLWVCPATGVAGHTVATGTQRFYFRTSIIETGTGTFSSAANTKLNAWATFTAPALQVPRSALVDKDLLDSLEPLAEASDALIDTIGTRTDVTGLFPLSRGADQFNAGNTALLYSATEDRVLEEIGIWSDNIGSGDANLVIATGSLPDLTFVSSTALTDATLTGPNRWALTTALTAGQHALLSVPSGGINQMTTEVSEETFRFATGTFTSGSKTFITSDDTRFHGYVKTSAPGVQITRADLHPALAAQIADIPLPIEFDIFLVIGQSNAVGSGGGVVATTSVPAGVMKQYYSGALTDKTADPIGNASNNSALPAFALEYWRRTGRGVIFVPAASGSTALVAAADAGSGNWSATGTLRAAAITLLNAAKTAANSAGLVWKFAGVLWCQGEQDAVAIDAATITKANYATEQGNLLTFLQTETGSGSTMPFIISVIGSRTVAGGGDTTGFQQIRAAQLEFAAGRANVFIGFAAAKTFVARNLMWDGVHYNALGYDEVGRHWGNTAAYACAGRA